MIKKREKEREKDKRQWENEEAKKIVKREKKYADQVRLGAFTLTKNNDNCSLLSQIP